MKYFFNIVLALLLTVSLTTQKAGAQVTTATTTTTAPPASTPGVATKADDVSDAELRSMVQKAKASGLSDDQIRQAAIAKGMAPEEADKLQNRISIIRTAKDANTPIDEKRKVIDDAAKTDDEKKAGGSGLLIGPGGLPIFGSELFSNSNLTFEPNLRIPTPQNYRLGPDDEIIVSVYGNSQIEWKLPINPEGSIMLPGIGRLNVGGKSIEQATGLITAKLISANYAIGHGTSVSVSLGNIRTIKVTMVGEITKPGTYSISSLSTVFNALYASGGPTLNGSFRKIQIIRDNIVVRTLDTYDYLLRGSQKDNIRLLDGDLIRVPTYSVRVTLSGEVKRQANYEVLPGETLKDVISFGGGFSDNAYTATIKAIQLTSQDRKVVDISMADFGNYIPLRGDSYAVDRILDSFENRVTIFGAVTRPGLFELTNGLTLSQLIAKAAGLKPDAFGARGFISRLKVDNTVELIPFDVRGIVNKTTPDILLKKEDVVSIPANGDLRDEYNVSINGEVRQPGQYSFSDKMSVEDLIVMAGGLTQAASPKRIEIARRVTDADPSQKSSTIAKISIINIDETFKVSGQPFILQPYDVVSIYTLPGYETQRTVRVEGEVLYPGPYTLMSKNEKISSVLKRAGGLTVFADVESATLKRTNVLGIDQKGKVDANAVAQEKVDRLRHIQKTLRDSTTSINEQLQNEFVGIDLKKILVDPETYTNLVLEEGDIIRVPKQQQLVKVNGEVLFPSSVVYHSTKGLADFVDNAGGFSEQALRRRAYVIYPNGEVRSTHNFIFFRTYPRIKPGSEIVIPKKLPHRGISAVELSSIAAALGSAAAVLIGVISITRR